MFKHTLAALTGAVAITAGLAPTADAFTLYTDRSDWEAAMEAARAVQLTTDTFSNFIGIGSSITFDSGVQSTGENGLFLNSVTFGSYQGLIDTDNDGFLPSFESITWEFPTEVIGFGADFFSAASGEILQVVGDFDGNGEEVIDFGTAGVNFDFLGVVGHKAFTEIVFQTRTDNSGFARSQFWAADNLSFGERVPEPTTTLALFAFGAVAVAKQLKKKSA